MEAISPDSVLGLTEREQAVLLAFVKTDPKWVEAMEFSDVAKTAWYLARTMTRIMDDVVAGNIRKIEDLDLSVRAYNVLKREGIHTVEQLADLSWDQLLDFRNLGARSIDEISAKLQRIGKQIKPTYNGITWEADNREGDDQ